MKDAQGKPTQPLTTEADGQKAMKKIRDAAKARTAKRFQECADRAKRAADKAAAKTKEAKEARAKVARPRGLCALALDPLAAPVAMCFHKKVWKYDT